MHNRKDNKKYQITYTLYDENNQVINIIENDGNCYCCSIIYNFFDANKNVENTLIMRTRTCDYIYELYDKYNTLTNRIELYHEIINNGFLEYDVNEPNRVIKIKNNPFKIFENEKEGDLDKKTFFNKGFSKFQTFWFLRHQLFYDDSRRHF